MPSPRPGRRSTSSEARPARRGPSTTTWRRGETFEVDRAFSDVSADDYDALIVPGGTVGADRLRLDDEGVDLVREHVSDGKPAGVICHGPWLLVEAGVVDGRTLTSYPSLRTDVRNVGGEWVDEEVVTDGTLVTSRRPDDLPAFWETIVETVAGESERSPN